jgi:hypothetical protein
MPLTLWFTLIVTTATAAVFFALSATLLRRPMADEGARIANLAFGLWWFAVGAQETVVALRIPLALAEAPLSLMVGFTFASLAAVTLGLAALLYYLLYLFTGRTVVSWPLLLFYSVYCGWGIQYLATRRPMGYDVTPWGVSIDYVLPASPLATLTALLVLVGPPLVAVGALLVLSLRMPRGPTRLRVVVLALATAMWFSSAIVAAGLGASADAWQAVATLIPLAVGIAVLTVYRPPPWLRERLGGDERESLEPAA